MLKDSIFRLFLMFWGLFVFLGVYGCQRGGEVVVYRDEGTALEAVSREGKPLLVYFGADWCEDCQYVEAALKEEEVQKKLKGYVFLKIDATKSNAEIEALMEKYGVEDMPHFVRNGEVLHYKRDQKLSELF